MLNRFSGHVLGCSIVLAGVLSPRRADAQPVPPAPHQEDSFDMMHELAQHGLHDLTNESWNLYGQYTYITSYHPALNAPYTNINGSVNSLWQQPERGFTETFTFFAALRLWPGAEAYVVPEWIAERAFSTLHGLGGSTENFELQKTGAESPTLYRSRLYLRQTIKLGGERVEVPSDPMQLAAVVSSRRLVLTAGNLSALDIFNRNSIVGDLRQTFFNEAWMTDASWDFPADARGYTYGITAELYWDDWALRFGRFIPPLNPNSYPVEPPPWTYYGDTLEIEHDHQLFGLPGAVRVLAYRNYEYMGYFDDAVAAVQSDPTRNAASCPSSSWNYASGNFRAPDLCWVRKPNVKLGIGINIEQTIADGIGVFGRAMYSDGRGEVDAFDSADRDASIGVVARGPLWHRPLDVSGVAVTATWISSQHARYMALGGIDAFTGDGKLDHVAPEELFETFYSFNLFKALWLAADYQFLANPAYNAGRGPEHVFSGRVHAEF